MMGDDDLDARGEMNEQARWGENRGQRAMRKLLLEQSQNEDDLRAQLVDLRRRVKALEDARP